MKTTESGVRAAGLLLGIGALMLVIGLFAHPAESADPQQAMRITAQNATAWRATHLLIAGGSLLVAAAAFVVLAARSRLTGGWLGTAGWALLGVSMLLFVPIPAIEATAGADAAVGNDAATFGVVGVVESAFLAISVLAITLSTTLVAASEAQRATGTQRTAASVGAVLGVAGLLGAVVFVWVSPLAVIGFVNILFGALFLWPLYLGVALARGSPPGADATFAAPA